MPRYRVQDPRTGKSLLLEGESPPTQAELEDIFRRSFPALPPAQSTNAPTNPRLRDPLAQFEEAGKSAARTVGNIPAGVGEVVESLGSGPMAFSPVGAPAALLREGLRAGGVGEGNRVIDIPRIEELLPQLQEDGATFGAEAVGAGVGTALAAGGLQKATGLGTAASEIITDLLSGAGETESALGGAAIAVLGQAPAGLGRAGRRVGEIAGAAEDKAVRAIVGARTDAEREALEVALPRLKQGPTLGRASDRVAGAVEQEGRRAQGALRRRNRDLEEAVGGRDVGAVLDSIPGLREDIPGGDVENTIVDASQFDFGNFTPEELGEILRSGVNIPRSVPAPSAAFRLERRAGSPTFGLHGPQGEKLGGRILDDRIELVSIGKGDSPDSRSAVQALRDLSRREGKPVYFTSNELSLSGGDFRERMVRRGDLVRDDIGYRLTEGDAPAAVGERAAPRDVEAIAAALEESGAAQGLPVDAVARALASDPSLAQRVGVDISTESRFVADPISPFPAMAREVENFESGLRNSVSREAERQGVDLAAEPSFVEADAKDLNLFRRALHDANAQTDLLGKPSVAAIREEEAKILEDAILDIGRSGRPMVAVRELEDRLLRWGRLADAMTRGKNLTASPTGGAVTGTFAALRGDVLRMLAVPAVFEGLRQLAHSTALPNAVSGIARPLARAIAAGDSSTALRVLGRVGGRAAVGSAIAGAGESGEEQE